MTELPAGVGIRLAPGAKVIVLLHLHLMESVEFKLYKVMCAIHLPENMPVYIQFYKNMTGVMRENGR